MVQSSEIILQNKIELDNAWKNIDLYGEELSLGPSKNLQRIMEGEVTIGIPVIGCVIENRKESDSISWDYYSIYLPFTLHRLDGNRCYESAVFQVTLDDAEITVVDLFPQDIMAETMIEKRLSISSDLYISFKQAGVGVKYESLNKYILLTPLITAFGKGQQKFYWEYKGFHEQPVSPGDKQAVAILRVPHGTTEIKAQIDYKAIIQETIYYILNKKEVKSGIIPITWSLPKFS